MWIEDWRFGIGLLASLVAVFGQAPAIPSPAGRPEFEVASIKPSAPGAIDQVRVGLHLDGSQVSCTSLTLKEYMAIAYRVKRYQISGPDWIGSDRFDINAKLPAGSSGKQMPEMLQALLEDRFKMKMHRETTQGPSGVWLGTGEGWVENARIAARYQRGCPQRPRGRERGRQRRGQRGVHQLWQWRVLHIRRQPVDRQETIGALDGGSAGAVHGPSGGGYDEPEE